ncbi:MAG: 3'-5' exonuclease, partial [bacterium]
LVRSDVSGSVIDENLVTPHNYIKNTNLDNLSDVWARLFVEMLFYLFNEKALLTDFLDNWIFDEINLKDRGEIKDKLKFLKKTSSAELQCHINIFENIAKLLCPKDYSNNSLKQLENVLKDDESLCSYYPISDNEMQIMTIHKSKGLEFKAVFHLDLYKYIIPSYQAPENTTIMQEDLNLHYVALTRAKKVCFLLSSSKRINYKKRILDGIPSEFLSINGLRDYRQNVRTIR